MEMPPAEPCAASATHEGEEEQSALAHTVAALPRALLVEAETGEGEGIDPQQGKAEGE